MHLALHTWLYTLGSRHSALCTRLYALGPVHSALCTWLYALGSMHLALCTWLYALGSTHSPMRLSLCTRLYALGSVHSALCAWLYLHLVLCTWLYALGSMHLALCTWLYARLYALGSMQLAPCTWLYVFESAQVLYASWSESSARKNPSRCFRELHYHTKFTTQQLLQPRNDCAQIYTQKLLHILLRKKHKNTDFSCCKKPCFDPSGKAPAQLHSFTLETPDIRPCSRALARHFVRLPNDKNPPSITLAEHCAHACLMIRLSRILASALRPHACHKKNPRQMISARAQLNSLSLALKHAHAQRCARAKALPRRDL